jgi:ubiquinone/menaquinone biosynthesis C-methylase UbiE
MTFSRPADVLEKFGVHEGQQVADLGAGSGYYALAASKIVGDSGKVYVVEVQNEILVRLAREAKREHISNIAFLHTDMERPGGTKIADSVVDSALVCNVLFQIENRPEFLEEVRRILKPSGRVLAVDW